MPHLLEEYEKEYAALANKDETEHAPLTNRDKYERVRFSDSEDEGMYEWEFFDDDN
jgi:DUF971 family protein